MTLLQLAWALAARGYYAWALRNLTRQGMTHTAEWADVWWHLDRANFRIQELNRRLDHAR